jgi:hypothetical protein
MKTGDIVRAKRHPHLEMIFPGWETDDDCLVTEIQDMKLDKNLNWEGAPRKVTIYNPRLQQFLYSWENLLDLSHTTEA